MNAEDLDPTTWRYTVQLDSGEAFKLKTANVRAEGTGGASDGNQAKGKGKTANSIDVTQKVTWLFSIIWNRSKGSLKWVS